MMHKRNKLPKKRPGAWFIKVRGSYLPASGPGRLTYLPFLAFLVFSCSAAFEGTDSWTMAILFIIPNWVAAAAIMTYIAARKS